LGTGLLDHRGWRPRNAKNLIDYDGLRARTVPVPKLYQNSSRLHREIETGLIGTHEVEHGTYAVESLTVVLPLVGDHLFREEVREQNLVATVSTTAGSP
jgi:hypothetical protein